MTDTVVAAIITTSGVILVGAISHWRRTHQPSQQEPKAVIIQPVISKAVSHPVSDIKPSVRPDRTSDLSHARISDVIEAVPPLQQNAVRDTFIGVTVTWRGKLFTASREDTGTYVTLRDISESGLIHCRSASFDCLELLVAPRGEEIIVTGKIKDIDKYGAQLYDCKFEIPQKAA
jgi:hypothetical protein